MNEQQLQESDKIKSIMKTWLRHLHFQPHQINHRLLINQQI